MEKVIRTAEEFRQQAMRKGITFVKNHDCSICNYPVGWEIKDGLVRYNSGCRCSGRNNFRPSSFQDIADDYNQQTNAKVIREMDEFWGFDDPDYKLEPEQELMFTFNGKEMRGSTLIEYFKSKYIPATAEDITDIINMIKNIVNSDGVEVDFDKKRAENITSVIEKGTPVYGRNHNGTRWDAWERDVFLYMDVENQRFVCENSMYDQVILSLPEDDPNIED